MWLFCRSCSQTVEINLDAPNACPRCGSREFSSRDEPKKPYELTDRDRRLLGALRIASSS